MDNINFVFVIEILIRDWLQQSKAINKSKLKHVLSMFDMHSKDLSPFSKAVKNILEAK